MIVKAQGKYPELNFQVIDATNIDMDEKFDAVFSNAVLHWITSPMLVLESVHRVLKDNGRFIVEFGGKGNCNLITQCTISIMQKT